MRCRAQAADLLTQKAIEGKSWAGIDWRRNGLFTVFGFAYQGCFQYYLYVTLFSRWFAGAARFANQPFRAKLTDYAGRRSLFTERCAGRPVHGAPCGTRAGRVPCTGHAGACDTCMCMHMHMYSGHVAIHLGHVRQQLVFA